MPEMQVHAIYRSSPSGGKRRPEWFSKRTALLSFLRAARACSAEVRIAFLNDGEIGNDCRVLMDGAGDVIQLGGIGNCRSYRVALAHLEQVVGAPGDLAYLAEEDYVYVEDAFDELVQVAARVPDADYFNLHDHPDYYRAGDMPHRQWFEAGARRWRTVDHATMTFGARLDRLRRDAWLHWLGTQKDYPHDGGIWKAALGAPRYRLASAVGGVDLVPHDSLVLRHAIKAWAPGGKPSAMMVVPVPTLATHAEVTDIAPGVDWESEVDAVVAWGSAQGLPDQA